MNLFTSEQGSGKILGMPSKARPGNTNARRNHADEPKACTSCDKTQPPSAFRLTRYGTLSSWCNDCARQAKRDYWTYKRSVG